MILSHRHQYIFLHCRKVAGSSMTCFLNKHLGDEDLQVGVWHDAIVNGGAYNAKLRKELKSARGLMALGASSAQALMKAACKRQRPGSSQIINNANKRMYQRTMGIQPAHATAQQVRDFAPEQWDTYFKFCFVRNPYDRMYSDFNWRMKNRKPITFIEFLERVGDPDRPDPEGYVPEPRTNWPIYTIDDQLAVDYVGRFEQLADDFKHVCERIGLSFEENDLPFAKQRPRDAAGYRSHYGDAEKQLVGRICEKELDLFKYTF